MSCNESLRLDGTHGDNWIDECVVCGNGGDRADMVRVGEAWCHKGACAAEREADGERAGEQADGYLWSQHEGPFSRNY